MVYCCVPQCKSEDKKDSGISFHKFPPNADLREKWLKAISRQGLDTNSKWQPSERSVVCSSHFDSKCYSISTKNKRLLPNSVPTILLGYPSCWQRQYKEKHSVAEINMDAIKNDPEAENESKPIFSVKQEHVSDGEDEEYSDVITHPVSEEEAEKPMFVTCEVEIKNELPSEESVIGVDSMVKEEPDVEDELSAVCSLKEEPSTEEEYLDPISSVAVKVEHKEPPADAINEMVPGKQREVHLHQVWIAKCEVCLKTFTLHEFVPRTKQKLDMCEACSKYFDQCGDLKVKTEDKRFKCLLCSKSFIERNKLVIHTRIHTGDRPYKCETCGKCVKEQGALVVHKRIHTGDKRYKCEACGKCFIQKSSLVVHQRTHSREQTIQM